MDMLELAGALKALGVRHCFGVTGSGLSWELISALEDLRVKYHPAGHEACAAIMAGGAVRASGLPSVSISIKGPGLANMAAGMAFNRLEHLPVLSVSESFGPADPPFRMHKRIDHRALVSAQAKAYLGWCGGGLDALWAEAVAEIPGPVHIDLGNGFSGEISTFVTPPAVNPRTPIHSVLRMVSAARRPLVIAGSLAFRRPWGQRISGLRAPVLTTAAAKGLIDERSSHSAGVFTGAGRGFAPEVAILPEADLIVAFGLRNHEILSQIQFPCPAILVDELGGLAEGMPWAAELIDPNGPDALLDGLGDICWGAEHVAAALESLRTHQLSFPWTPAACFELLDAAPWDHALVLDTGSFCTIGEHLWRASPNRPCYGSPNGRFMGTSLPAAIGAALARPDLPMVCAMGDGGIRMYPGELKLAVAENLPLCVVFMRDGSFGSIAATAGARRVSRAAVEPPLSSWHECARGMGCEAVEARDPAAFAEALASWDRHGPMFIEATFDRSTYLHICDNLR